MGSKRLARLNEQFRREISQILRKEVRDPRVGTPTITGVEVTPDLWMARVFVRPGPEVGLQMTGGPPSPPATTPGHPAPPSHAASHSPTVPPRPPGSPSGTGSPPGPDPAQELLAGLAASAPFIRRELGKVLSLRRIPELRFQLDRSLEHAARIEALLREVRPDDREDLQEEGEVVALEAEADGTGDQGSAGAGEPSDPPPSASSDPPR